MHVARLTLVLVPFASAVAVLAACGDRGSPPAPSASSPAEGSAPSTIPGEGSVDVGSKADGGVTTPPSADAGLAEGPNCPGYNALKNLYWGDLHGHTSFSLDAFGFGTRNDPYAAYAFSSGAPGGTITIADGVTADGGQLGQTPGPTIGPLSPPLDFAAITDHSEFLGEAYGCVDTSPDNVTFYGSQYCQTLRNQGSEAQATEYGLDLAHLAQVNPSQPVACTDFPDACPREATKAWSAEQDAVDKANNRCTFTAFKGFEWTAETTGPMQHRCVIFANDNVPAMPLDYLSYPSPPQLWSALNSQCTGTCQALTIPHNSNLSGGLIFDTKGYSTSNLANMSKYQTLVEMFQNKGNSECYTDTSDTGDDRECDFELLPAALDAKSQPGYVRSALEQGLADYATSARAPNVDDFKLGFIGDTDTHNATQGNTNESTWPGHLGANDNTAAARVAGSNTQSTPQWKTYNPAGVTGVWAEENTRESIFGALQRREVYATSGTRIALRFYAYPATLANPCTDPNFPAAVVAAGGLPMGSTIPPRSGPMAFVLYALKDQTDLMQVEIFKASYAAGAPHESSYVFTEGSNPPGALSASMTGGQACVTWQDPDFVATSPALYYARVLEQPTPRWSTFDCATVEAANPTTWQESAPGCACNYANNGQTITINGTSITCSPDTTGILDVDIHERAWGSPIWNLP